MPVVDPLGDAADEILESLTAKAHKAEAAPLDVDDPDDPKMVLSPIKVDKFNTINRRVELTEAVCELCGLDVCYEYKLPAFKALDPIAQTKIKAAVLRHKENCGKVSPQIIRKSQMTTRWMSDERLAAKKAAG